MNITYSMQRNAEIAVIGIQPKEWPVCDPSH